MRFGCGGFKANFSRRPVPKIRLTTFRIQDRLDRLIKPRDMVNHLLVAERQGVIELLKTRARAANMDWGEGKRRLVQTQPENNMESTARTLHAL